MSDHIDPAFKAAEQSRESQGQPVDGVGREVSFFDASPVPMMATETADLIERLSRHADEQIDDNLAYIKTADDLMREAATALSEKDRRIGELRDLVDRLKLEAQTHAGEARGANATIHEAYQAVTEGKGEPGSWSGAVPIKKELDRLRAHLAFCEADTKRNFNLGYTIAVANLINLYDQPGMAADVMCQTDITMRDIRAMGLTEYDMKPLRKMYREEAALRGGNGPCRTALKETSHADR